MNINELENLVEKFNLAKESNYPANYLDELAEKIQMHNMFSYGEQTSFIYRRNKINSFEIEKWRRLSNYIEGRRNLKLFDSAFGSGRDLLLAKDLGYDVYGCELSEFLYTNFLANTKFDSRKIVHCDLRDIPFPNEIFDVIRHNASFLHMPLIEHGYTVHKCLEESHRLLKNDGYLYIFTKEGAGFIITDTLDGLGPRSFQLYNEQTLGDVLETCGFAVKCFNHYNRNRNGKSILWLEAFAQKIN